jgi:hypothetical protein
MSLIGRMLGRGRGREDHSGVVDVQTAPDEEVEYRVVGVSLEYDDTEEPDAVEIAVRYGSTEDDVVAVRFAVSHNEPELESIRAASVDATDATLPAAALGAIEVAEARFWELSREPVLGAPPTAGVKVSAEGGG